MMQATVLYAAMLFFGFVATEGVVEYVLGTLFDKVEKLAPFKWTLMYASLAVGIFLAFYYGLDVVNIGLGLPFSPVGIILTGVVMGRGANLVSDVWQKFFGTFSQRVGIRSDDLVDLADDNVDENGTPF